MNSLLFFFSLSLSLQEDPYYKSNTAKPPLPPFSSLRPHLPFTASGYGSSRNDTEYETYQQQKTLHLASTYLQDNSSHHFHPHSSSADFSLHSLAGGLQSFSQLPQVNSCQLSFHNGSKQDSHFHVRDQSQFLNSLQQPPIPDISLSLPFSTGHEHILGSSHLPSGTKSFSNVGLFPNNPPLIPLSQIESFLSETEQNSLSDFNTLSQTVNDNDMISSWQTLYNSEPTEPSQQLTSYSGLSSLMSMASGTWENTQNTYSTSDLPSNSSKVATFSKNQCVPDSSYRFIPSTSSLSGCSSSQYQMSGSSYPGNTFLSKSGSMINNSGSPFAEFSRTDSNYETKNQIFHVHSQNIQASPGNKAYSAALNTSQKTSMVVINENVPATKGSHKGRRKKKLAVDSLDHEVKTVMKKKRVKTSKKAGLNPNHESSLTDDDESATFCLSPTFIASLSSKRASDSQQPTAQSDPYIRHQEGIHQRSHSVESAQNADPKEFQAAENIPIYTSTSAAHHSIETSHRDGFPQISGSHQSNVRLFRRNDFPSISCTTTAPVSSTNDVSQTLGSYPTTSHLSSSSPLSNTNGAHQIVNSYPSTVAVSSTTGVPQTFSSYQNTAGLYQSTVPLSVSSEFSQTFNSHMSYASFIAAPSALAQSEAQRSDKKQDCELPIRQSYAMYAHDIKPGLKSSKNKLHELVKVDIKEDRSSSPFQLSPGFISSLSSKRAEEHPVHNVLMKTSSAVGTTLGMSSHLLPAVSSNSIYHFSRQPMQSSVSSSTDNIFVTYAQSKLQSSSLPTSYVRQVISPPITHLLTRSDFPASQEFSSHKYSGYPGNNFETLSAQTVSPKPYVSPPAFPKGSKFQYPTPPMEDDEGRLQSPGPCLSPGFLDSLSQKVSSSELSQRLTPVHDDSVPALPTPPNSAGPKQFSIPDMTLSKEEQTNRILEIIAREREKLSITSQISDVEPKKRKRKKRSKEIGNTDNCSNDSSIPGQMEQPIVSFHPELSLHNNADVMPAMYPFHNKPVQQEIMWSEGYADSFGSEQPEHKFKWENSHGTIGDLCIRNESLQSQPNEHNVVEFQNTGDSTKLSAIDLNKGDLEEVRNVRSSEGIRSFNQSPPSKFDIMNRSRTLREEPCKSDPYAFDDSEQMDLNTSRLRSLKPVVNLPYMDQSEPHYVNPVSHVPFNAHNKQSDPRFSDVPFETQMKPFYSKQNLPTHPAFYPVESKTPLSKHMLTAEKVQNKESLLSASYQTKESKNFSKGRHFQTDTMIIKSEPSNMFFNTDDSVSQTHQPIFNTKQHIENQERSHPVSNTTSTLKSKQKQKMHRNNGYFHGPHGLSCSEATANTQVSSMDYVQECPKPFPDALAGLNGHTHDTLTNRLKVSLDTAKKKRGRPPKSICSNLSLPVKAKMPKLKLYDKKTTQTPTKMLYKLNGIEVKPSDLNLNQNLVDRLANNLMEVADCSCLGPDREYLCQ